MIFNWLRRCLKGFRVDDEVRRLFPDREDELPPQPDLPTRDAEADDRKYEEVRRHTDEANSALYRFEMQRALRNRSGYHRNGA
jgi:hypothetical protein